MSSIKQERVYVVEYHLNRLDEPIFMAVPKPMLTEFGIQYRLESYAELSPYHHKM